MGQKKQDQKWPFFIAYCIVNCYVASMLIIWAEFNITPASHNKKSYAFSAWVGYLPPSKIRDPWSWFPCSAWIEPFEPLRGIREMSATPPTRKQQSG